MHPKRRRLYVRCAAWIGIAGASEERPDIGVVATDVNPAEGNRHWTKRRRSEPQRSMKVWVDSRPLTSSSLGRVVADAYVVLGRGYMVIHDFLIMNLEGCRATRFNKFQLPLPRRMSEASWSSASPRDGSAPAANLWPRFLSVFASACRWEGVGSAS
jgi:hypothetical protein